MTSAKRSSSLLRRFLTWSSIIILTVYILYSFNVIFNSRYRCPGISAKENLDVDAPYLNTTDSLALAGNSDDRSTGLKHVVFGIATSSKLWEKRKEYIKVWWRPGETRGVVWLDKPVRFRHSEGLPEIKISGNTTKFPYSNRQGSRSALRISRVVSETFRLGMEDVRWFVMGDDDTVFMVENVLRVLSKYDHNEYYYIGSSSESHIQNIFFSYAMAYGGGGFAISYPLAKELRVFGGIQGCTEVMIGFRLAWLSLEFHSPKNLVLIR